MEKRINIERYAKILKDWIDEADADDLMAVFDNAFGTKSDYDILSEEVIVKPGKDYGGILEEIR